MQCAYSVVADFAFCKVDNDHIFTGLISELPEQYEDDYFIYTSREVLNEGETAEDLPLIDLMRRRMFRNFDNWVTQEFYKETKE